MMLPFVQPYNAGYLQTTWHTWRPGEWPDSITVDRGKTIVYLPGTQRMTAELRKRNRLA
ncbi:hypothetical protein [Taibaiella koreensis]|uniref:hypothetical protein n=1 Tax=Taibaiella koreensis TaxID=1268548 RepID=UPI0013C32335|nr:hypothetical protein [Taibaiella koreensis]